MVHIATFKVPYNCYESFVNIVWYKLRCHSIFAVLYTYIHAGTTNHMANIDPAEYDHSFQLHCI